MPGADATGPMPSAVTLRTVLGPGDVEAIAALHGDLYAREHGFDRTFEEYVAEPLGAFARTASPRERIWIAERGGRVIGCVAVVAAERDVAQLRWFLVDPAARGAGLGTRLLAEAVDFARGAGYRSVVLWTVSALAAAARLYRAAGFRVVETRPGRPWGVEVIEEKHELDLLP